MRYDALIRSYQEFLPRASDRCRRCTEGKPRSEHECEYPDEVVRAEIKRLQQLQRDEMFDAVAA